MTLFGTPDELHTAGVIAHRHAPGIGPGALGARGVLAASPGPPSWLTRSLRSARHLAASLLQAMDRRLVAALFALFSVIIASTVILRLAYRLGGHHIPLLDAVYFTAETVTTVNYGDFSYIRQSPWLMGGAVVLMLLGALFVAVFFAMLTDMLVSRRIEESLGRAADHRAARPCAGHRPGLGGHAGRVPAGRRGQRGGRGREARR